ncbi:MAG: class I SAM-dependent rRNA methyltransferase [Anaerolineae bacterium]|nr:class I SAM-dependent rRNA methyltransferase [Anaerolineae bacterium]
MRLPILNLPADLKSRLSQGHPWIYRNHVIPEPDLASGAWVQVRCGAFSAFGLWDARSAIAVRLYSQHGVPDAGWVADRVAEAWQVRTPVRAGVTSGYRWVYGESDRLPGIVVDLYGEFAVIQTYADSVEPLVPWVADALHAHTALKGVLWRPAGGELKSLWGRLPPSDLTVEEHGLLFNANLFAGQKTGLFFDQRENRRTLAAWCQGQAVLDCFCYTGGFTVHACRGGAETITACDASASALEAARRNLVLNGFDPLRHTFLAEDCFKLLERLGAEGRRFGVVILDPPSFSRDRQSRHTAVRAYVRLNRLALSCVEPGGLLASASCTSQVSPVEFHQALAEAARQADRRLLILHDAGQPVDHPVPAHFPEARYLKFVVSRVLPLA